MKIPYTVTIDPEQVARITPENLLAYALSTGWTAVHHFQYATIVTRPFADGIFARFVRIPNTLETEDWSERVSDALRTFSEAEQRDPRDIVRDIVEGASAESAYAALAWVFGAIWTIALRDELLMSHPYRKLVDIDGRLCCEIVAPGYWANRRNAQWLIGGFFYDDAMLGTKDAPSDVDHESFDDAFAAILAWLRLHGVVTP